LHLAR